MCDTDTDTDLELEFAEDEELAADAPAGGRHPGVAWGLWGLAEAAAGA